ncbi:glycosyltransferase family 2 protein [Flavobacterium sp. PL002]|uniref:glycosyltransferase family 2 protein n=1 Tax=Flavobacterium sp. PL002 TaxID=1897058 RepID=UPI001787EC76|nr:glycosyltransferase family 2 protein [Flavobacterium sp. PL002]MBE0391145.1 hypothetical protein [Flavobacterium sp. PL002]
MLAIIIPFYKLTFFEETLQSLANQTDKRFKVYIGDDASPENPLSLIQKYQGKFEHIYHRFEENVGGTSLVKQWDRCIALSQNEEWIMILGDDDYLDAYVVASWYENYNQFYKKAEVIRFATKMIVQENNEVSEKFEHPVWESATDSYLRKFNHQTRSSLSEYIFSRKTYIKHHFYDYPLAWNSDDQAWLDFSWNKPIYSINESIVFVRLSQLNISGKTDNCFLKNKSQVSFYKKIIYDKLLYYKKKERTSLLRKYENEILKTRKLTLSEWKDLFYYYLRFFNFKEFKKITKRFLKTIFKSYDY